MKTILFLTCIFLFSVAQNTEQSSNSDQTGFFDGSPQTQQFRNNDLISTANYEINKDDLKKKGSSFIISAVSYLQFTKLKFTVTFQGKSDKDVVVLPLEPSNNESQPALTFDSTFIDKYCDNNDQCKISITMEVDGTLGVRRDQNANISSAYQLSYSSLNKSKNQVWGPFQANTGYNSYSQIMTPVKQTLQTFQYTFQKNQKAYLIVVGNNNFNSKNQYHIAVQTKKGAYPVVSEADLKKIWSQKQVTSNDVQPIEANCQNLDDDYCKITVYVNNLDKTKIGGFFFQLNNLTNQQSGKGQSTFNTNYFSLVPFFQAQQLQMNEGQAKQILSLQYEILNSDYNIQNGFAEYSTIYVFAEQKVGQLKQVACSRFYDPIQGFGFSNISNQYYVMSLWDPAEKKEGYLKNNNSIQYIEDNYFHQNSNSRVKFQSGYTFSQSVFMQYKKSSPSLDHISLIQSIENSNLVYQYKVYKKIESDTPFPIPQQDKALEFTDNIYTVLDLKKDDENVLFTFYQKKQTQSAYAVMLQNGIYKPPYDNSWIVALVCSLIIILTILVGLLVIWIIRRKYTKQAKEYVSFSESNNEELNA